jgi:GNAT superfamily N-acetyltransferase
VNPRVVTPSSVQDAVGVLVGAFHHDALWSWAFPDEGERPAQLRRWWGLCVEGAVRYPWTWLSEGNAATSAWIPPGGTELSDEQADRVEPLLVDLLGPGAARVLATLEMFEQAHPHAVPHYYLSLLGTDPSRIGHGHGLRLLADNLRLIDAEGAAAYLEASSLVNVPLYRRHGFEAVGSFRPPEGGPEVVTMWRDPHPEAVRSVRSG